MKAIDLIRDYRIKKGISMKECAKIINLSIAGYSEIEHHRVKLSADDFLALVKFLNIDLNNFSNIIETNQLKPLTKDEIKILNCAVDIIKNKVV